MVNNSDVKRLSAASPQARAAEAGERRRLPDGSESMYHEGSFGAYMALKIQKQQQQFAEQAAGLGLAATSRLFEGVGIYVDGRTQPSQAELKQLMHAHGGTFHVYETSAVTHIIASNLPDAKVKQYQRARNPRPVVRPEWVVASIAAGRLLPVQDFVLGMLRDAPGQQKLKPFLSGGPAALPEDAIYGQRAGQVGPGVLGGDSREWQDTAGAAGPPAQQQQQHAPSSTATGVPRGSNAAGAGLIPGAEQQQQQGGQFLGSGVPPPLQPLQQPPQLPHQQRLPPQQPQPPNAAPPSPPGVPAYLRQRPPPSSRQQQQYEAAGAGRYDPGEMAAAHALAARLRAACDNLKGPVRSCKDDPDFLANYFRSSRLHFIGSWKERVETVLAGAAAAPRPALPAPGRPRAIIHLDMDCFFASVTEAAHPLLAGKPLAVSHSASARGTGEVSTANYEARRYGVDSGMSIGRAKELCAQLIVVPYDFERYDAVTEEVYRILLAHTGVIQPLSCDEAYLDVTGLGDPGEIAASIRAQIFASTGCTASAGVGPNPLVARIATETGKPNGQHCVPASQAAAFLADLPVGKLPGVGPATEAKLQAAGVETVRDVQARSKAFLQGLLGGKAGGTLWDYAHGRDSRPVEGAKPRKSVGAEATWGVRFDTEAHAMAFMDTLAAEVERRLAAAGVRGRHLTLKLLRRKEGAGEPAKFMGCGACDAFSRSITLASAVSSARDLARHGKELMLALRVPWEEVRGVGLQVSKLDSDGAPGAAAGDAPSHLFAAYYQKQPAQPEEQQEPEQHDQCPEQQPQLHEQQPDQSSQHQQQPSPEPPQAPPGYRVAGTGTSPSKQHASLRHLLSKSAAAARAPTAEPPPAPLAVAPVLAPPPVGAADEDGEEVDGGPAAEEAQRLRLLDRYRGLTLSQIDAAELAALPYAVQAELVATLPRSRGDTLQVLATRPGVETRAAQPAPAAQQQQQQQHETAAEDEETDWSQPALSPGHGTAAVDAGAGGTPAPPPQQEQARQQEPGGRASGSRTPIEALPALSQVDPSVMDALPLPLRWELERAYGIGPQPRHSAPQHQQHGARRGQRGVATAARHQAGPGGQLARKRQRIDAFVVAQPPAASAAGAAQRAVSEEPATAGRQGGGDGALSLAHSRTAAGSAPPPTITLSQVDPTVLEELPPEVRAEVMRQLQPFPPRKRPHLPGRSRLGQQPPAQQRWGGTLAAQHQQEQQHEEQLLQEEQQGGGASSVACSAGGQAEAEGWEQLPAPVAEFALEASGGASSAQRLSASLATCLRQLESELLASDGGDGAAGPGGVSPGGGRTGGGTSPVGTEPPRSRCGSQQSPGGADKAEDMELDIPPTQELSVAAEPSAKPRGAGGDDASQGQEVGTGGGSQGRQHQQQHPALDAALAALVHVLRRAARALVPADLEQARQLLQALRRLAGTRPWFAAAAGDVEEEVQMRMERHYGRRLRLVRPPAAAALG